jgi:hypothetical protein
MSKKGLSLTTKAIIARDMMSRLTANSRHSSRGASHGAKPKLLEDLDDINREILKDMSDNKKRKKEDETKAINNYKLRFRVMAKQKGISNAVTEAFLDNLKFKYSNARLDDTYFLEANRTDKTIPEINKHLSMFSRIGGKKSKTSKKSRATKNRKTRFNRK